VTDYVYGAGMHWQGGCGGFPCDGSGSLNEWNVIGELKAAMAVAIRSAASIGAGAAIFRPSGHPTGGTTSFLGSATTPAVRIGWGMDHQFDQYRSAGFIGTQHTGSAEFETTSERFCFDRKNEVIFGLNLTYTPAGN
jgi:hypothetical protein